MDAVIDMADTAKALDLSRIRFQLMFVLSEGQLLNSR